MYQEFNACNKEQQIKFIVDMMGNNGSQEDIDTLKKIYEDSYSSNFDIDKTYYYYAFLKYVDINQAINLYDSLLDDKKIDLISAIKNNHEHLYTLVDIHEIIADMNHVDNIIYS